MISCFGTILCPNGLKSLPLFSFSFMQFPPEQNGLGGI
jgi:hypothetical protein